MVTYPPNWLLSLWPLLIAPLTVSCSVTHFTLVMLRLRHNRRYGHQHARLQLLLRLLHHSAVHPAQPLDLPLAHPTYQIWSANTSLGKTLVSAGLSSSFLLSSSSASNKKFFYLKPIQTGFPHDSDSRFIFAKLPSLSLRRHFPSSLFLSNSILSSSLFAAKSFLSSRDVEFQPEKFNSGMYDLNFCEETRILGENNAVSELVCKTLFAWEEAVSPHLAAERESGGAVGDSEVVETLGKCLRDGMESENERGKMEILCVVETAGGVASPGPSGSLQCDLYRPFRLPSILVGDGRLGGISGTISAYESLKLRGYDVVAVVFEDHGLVNEIPLMSYLRNRVPVLVLPPLPQDSSNELMEWFDDSNDIFDSLKNIMLLAYSERIQRLDDMPKRAGELFWWPFTQHKLVPEETVTVIDSRCGENFSVYQNYKAISQQFDACASWWTQGPDATLQIELARDMGYTAARFGHVMFPENVYEPALECAELLLQGVGKGWASRTYFSDNGSTAIEIALKMAFRKFSVDHEILVDFHGKERNEKRIDLKVLALKGSYHGDTLGAMEAQAPSPYTGFLQQPWYSGRGIFLDPPTVFMCNGQWVLSLPEIVELQDITFHSRDELFDKGRDNSDIASIYSSFISQIFLQNPGLEGSGCIGALIIEPVIHAAGGMHMVDPLFQRILVKECRNRKIPVIFDEVFTGFWRLGVESTADLLGCVPDVACYGKLLTGGVIPLAVTLATNAVFDSFVGDSKLKALLHGHSYSAHALGCAAAVKSIKWFRDPQTNHNVIPEKRLLKELWNSELIQQISSHPTVQRVVALGTLCALELRAEGCNAGYGSLYAASLLKKLREDGIFMRPLGNVIYLMCGPCTSPEVCSQLLVKLYRRLEEFNNVEEKMESC